jgi:hypothetical protein
MLSLVYFFNLFLLYLITPESAVLVFSSLGLETGKARSGFGAKPEKQFLFWDLRSKKAIASGCRVGGAGCRVRLGIDKSLMLESLFLDDGMQPLMEMVCNR